MTQNMEADIQEATAEKEKISILMPVKNATPYLTECLETILSQTDTNWELIAINDHSTDASKAVLTAFAEKDKRIQVFDNQAKGIITALRLAYTHSSGTYITRMDADDLMPPQKLTTLRRLLLEKGRTYIATGCVEYFSATGIRDGYLKYQNWLNDLTRSHTNFTDIYKECVIPSPCWMLHRADLEACGAFKADRYPEDYDLCFRMYEAGFEVVASDDILHLWRDHATRASRNDEHYTDNRFLLLKLYYFLKLETKKSRSLAVWGAGKKGKMIAQYLVKNKVDFHWVCENDRKIGVNIYDKILEAPSAILHLNEPQIIVAVAGEKQNDILAFLKKYTFEKGQDYFLFC